MGLGNPKTAACLLSMTLPQDTIGLRLQPGVKVVPAILASRILNLSIVMTHAASTPAAPVITSSKANARLPPSNCGGASARSDSGSVETSLTVVLLITPIPSLESWTFSGQGSLCRTHPRARRSPDIRKSARLMERHSVQDTDGTAEGGDQTVPALRNVSAPEISPAGLPAPPRSR